MDYEAALTYLRSFVDFEREPDAGQTAAVFTLDRIERLLSDLGRPHHASPVVHLAGTKGKGSTAALIESILRQAGFRTGLYISPHLHDFTERIRVNGRPIEPAVLTGLIEELRPILDSYRRPWQSGGLTAFEAATCLAFVWFARARVEVQIIETGLGGRLDATNVVEPAVAVVTPIGYDHQAILGSTLTAIAGEKAGILKLGCRAVIGVQPEAARRVFAERCAALGILPLLAGRDFTARVERVSDEAQLVRLQGPGLAGSECQAELPLLGRHQAENAALAAAASSELLNRLGRGALPVEAVRRGLQNIDWSGRFQVLRRRPWVVVDGAHTPESAERLAATVAEVLPHRKVTYVLSILRGKAGAEIAKALAATAHEIVATEADDPRALPADELVAIVERQGQRVRRAASVREALTDWSASAGPEEVVVATGSLRTAAEAIRWQAVRRAGPTE